MKKDKLFSSFLLLFFLMIPNLSNAKLDLHSFKITPSAIFTDQDEGIRFSVQLNSDGEKPKSLLLIETDPIKEKIRFRWPLNDEGSLGDRVPQDGIYSRTIQFKERTPKLLHFLIVPVTADLLNPENKALPSVEQELKATLEIKAHPTFQEILGNVLQKIRGK